MIKIIVLLAVAGYAVAQQSCGPNEVLNGAQCVCAPGYFSAANEASKSRCEDECEEVYYSWFTHGSCVGDVFGRLTADQRQPTCNMRCGMRLRWWTTVFIILAALASILTLILLLPMCCATCMSCFQSTKATKTVKKTQRYQVESQQQQQHGGGAGGGMEVAVAGKGGQGYNPYGTYNPYAQYGAWPYYGRAQ